MRPWHEARDAEGRWGGGSHYGARDRQEPPGLPETPPRPGEVHGALPPHGQVVPIPPEAWKGRPGIGDVSGLGTGWGTGQGNVELGEHWDAPGD